MAKRTHQPKIAEGRERLPDTDLLPAAIPGALSRSASYLRNHLNTALIITFLSIGAIGAILKYLDEDAQTERHLAAKDRSTFARLNPFLSAPSPSPTPQLSKEYIYAGSRLLAVEDANATSGSSRTNVALASNGGVASASSVLFSPDGTINGDRKGLNWSSGTGGWHDATTSTYPDWLQVNFNGTKTISEIDVITLQDDWQNPAEPTQSDTFTQYGITAFDVQYWDSSTWQTITGGSTTGNNKVWR
ncbi:MAG TPA: discoidin domain-containing protein, partial [Pyrinomonadaceae bacterium]|nr:discoidin domain-containing protein [Pyrinomonadaceae bacterium]